jgi:hypothetical protein
MIRMGWLQFVHSWRVWVTAIFIFIMSGWLFGFCLTGIFTLQREIPQLINTSQDLTPLFSIPLVFGGITLFLSLKGIIQAVLDEFKNEYQLWNILGANTAQISRLVAVQIGILTLIGTIMGFILAQISIGSVYGWLQFYIGEQVLPTISFNFSFWGFILTIGGEVLICYLAGYQDTKRILHARVRSNIFRLIQNWTRNCVLFIVVVALIKLYFFNNLSGLAVESKETIIANRLFAALFYLIIIQSLSGRFVLPFCLKWITRIKLIQQNAKAGTGRWNVITKPQKMMDTVIPILITQTIIVLLIELFFGIPGAQSDPKNMIVSFIVYIGAPICVVFGNIISLAMLKGRQQRHNLTQLNLMGFTRTDLILERLFESGYYAFSFWIGAMLTNIISYSIMAMGMASMRLENELNFSSIAVWSILVTVVLWAFLAVIDLASIHRWQRQNQLSRN